MRIVDNAVEDGVGEGGIAAYTVAGFRSELVAGIDWNRWPTSNRN